METYEQILEQMQKLSEGERKQKMEEMTKICRDYCGKCPSYEGTGETRLLFCGTGKSEIIKRERGCLCSECPVQEMMHMRWIFYCTRGSAKEQLAKE